MSHRDCLISGQIALLISIFFFSIMGISVKSLLDIPFYEIVFFRSIISFILCICALKIQKISCWGKHKKKLFCRGVTGTVSLVLYFLTLKTLPLSIAVALQYISPVFIVFVSWLFLGEKPSKIQMISLFIALGCVIWIQNIQAKELSVFVIFGIISAFFSALSFPMIRSLNRSEHPLVIVFYFASVTLVTLGPYTFLHWRMPHLWEFARLCMLGVSAQLGQYFLTIAYQREKAPIIANLSYLNVVSAFIVGEFFWGEHLSLKEILGIFIIIFCALISSGGWKNWRNYFNTRHF